MESLSQKELQSLQQRACELRDEGYAIGARRGEIIMLLKELGLPVDHFESEPVVPAESVWELPAASEKTTSWVTLEQMRALFPASVEMECPELDVAVVITRRRLEGLLPVLLDQSALPTLRFTGLYDSQFDQVSRLGDRLQSVQFVHCTDPAIDHHFPSIQALEGLQSMHINRARSLTEKGMPAQPFPQLRQLELIDLDALPAAAISRLAPDLRRLTIRNCGVLRDGLFELLRDLPSLQTLELWQHNLSVQTPHEDLFRLKSLRELVLRGAPFLTADEIVKLVCELPDLRYLDIRYRFGLTEDHLADIWDLNPDLRLFYSADQLRRQV